jgi:hypothetical protein
MTEDKASKMTIAECEEADSLLASDVPLPLGASPAVVNWLGVLFDHFVLDDAADIVESENAYLARKLREMATAARALPSHKP